jgi:hypothetical protein
MAPAPVAAPATEPVASVAAPAAPIDEASAWEGVVRDERGIHLSRESED